MYYALAKYKQPKSLAIIEELSRKECSADNYWGENLGYIYWALNKYKCDLYLPLIEQVEIDFKKTLEYKRFEGEGIESMTYLKDNDPWSY